jgi:hypothetical protein
MFHTGKRSPINHTYRKRFKTTEHNIFLLSPINIHVISSSWASRLAWLEEWHSEIPDIRAAFVIFCFIGRHRKEHLTYDADQLMEIYNGNTFYSLLKYLFVICLTKIIWTLRKIINMKRLTGLFHTWIYKPVTWQKTFVSRIGISTKLSL